MTVQKRKRLATLLSKVVDGRSDDSDIEELEDLMTGDQRARAYYLNYIALHSELEGLGSQLAKDDKKVTKLRPGYRPAIVGLAACAIILIGLGLWYRVGKDESPSPTITAENPRPDVELEEVFAVIGDAIAAKWNLPGEGPKRGAKLGPGPILLQAGVISLDFPSGEMVMVSAPASFEIVDGRRLKLERGECLLVSPPGQDGFAISTPTGSIVNLGARFAIAVDQSGQGSIRVLDGNVVASTVNRDGVTSWERHLISGDSYVMVKNQAPERGDFTGRLLKTLNPEIPPQPFGSSYSSAVMNSNPLGYWRFNVSPGTGVIPDEQGEVSLELGQDAETNVRGVLVLDGQVGDFAMSSEAFSQINSEDGFSLELWASTRSVAWQSVAGLILDQYTPDPSLPNATHNPHLLSLERAGVSGSNWHHVHPDFAIRSLYRSPAGYVGGVNAYSEAHNLLHDWHHYVVVREKGKLLIYVDGELSGSSSSTIKADRLGYRLLLGRVHAFPKRSEARPFFGVIDEVALYDRPLTGEEVKQHYRAAE